MCPLLRLLTCGRKSVSTDSSPNYPRTADASRPPLRLIEPRWFPLTAATTIRSARQEMLRHLASEDHPNPPDSPAALRIAVSFYSLTWLLANFPQRQGESADGYIYWVMGAFPRDIEYPAAAGEGKEKTTIPQADTELWLFGSQGDPSLPRTADGRKQTGYACLALVVQPLAETAGTQAAAAMRAAEEALLGLMRELQDVGPQAGEFSGVGPMGEALEGCVAVVFMGPELSVYEYSRERGLFEPPGGVEFEEKVVDLKSLFGDSYREREVNQTGSASC